MTLRVLSIGSAVNESTLSLTNFPRTISQTSSLFRQSQHKRYCRQCSDVTCTKKYALTKGPKRGGGGGVNLGHTLSAPPPIVLFLLRAWVGPSRRGSLRLNIVEIVWNFLTTTTTGPIAIYTQWTQFITGYFLVTWDKLVWKITFGNF